MDLIIMAGPTGCGKTTYRRSKLAHIPCVSPDDYIAGKWSAFKAKAAWAHANIMAREILGVEGSDLVVDAQFVNPLTRAEWLKLGRHFNAKIHAICFNTGFKQIMENHAKRGDRGGYGTIPESVIKRAWVEWEAQSPWSIDGSFAGFDSVKVVNW